MRRSIFGYLASRKFCLLSIYLKCYSSTSRCRASAYIDMKKDNLINSSSNHNLNTWNSPLPLSHFKCVALLISLILYIARYWLQHNNGQRNTCQTCWLTSLVPEMWPRGMPSEKLFSPLRANFFRGNINIYLHFMSFIHIDLTQVLKALPQVREGLTHSI